MLGALIIDKPAGLTSHDVVARVRRATGVRRVGHAGTLDPFATGVLVVCVGRATRLAQYLVGLAKEYVATVRTGYATNTQDLTGKQITPLRTSKETSPESIRAVLAQFTGEQMQTPPMFSAKKVGGEKLYRAARAGREIAREPVSITIHTIELVEDDQLTVNDDGTRDFRMRVRCSSGTYVRTLAHDIGERLGVGAHLVGLRRTSVGHFKLDGALALDRLERMSTANVGEVIIKPTDMLSHLAALAMDEHQCSRVKNGQTLALSASESTEVNTDAAIRLCDRDGNLIAVGRYDQDGRFVRPEVVIGVEVV